MKFTPTFLAGAYIIDPIVHEDDRGQFIRTFCKKEFSEIGFHGEWVQLNHSITFRKGTIRGLHFQKHPFGEVKMVKCIKGSIYDVIVDLRKDSETFLKWTSIELSAENKRMLFIPKGFAHGFQTLESNCELIYHHSEFYYKDAEDGVRYSDPMIGIKWPHNVSEISERDRTHNLLDKEFKGV